MLDGAGVRMLDLLSGVAVAVAVAAAAADDAAVVARRLDLPGVGEVTCGTVSCGTDRACRASCFACGAAGCERSPRVLEVAAAAALPVVVELPAPEAVPRPAPPVTWAAFGVLVELGGTTT